MSMIDKVKEFCSKHKTEILIILGALISFFTSLEVLGGKAAVIFTLVVAFLELVVYIIKDGITETTLNMCVKSIKMMVDILNGEYNTVKVDDDKNNEDVMSACSLVDTDDIAIDDVIMSVSSDISSTADELVNEINELKKIKCGLTEEDIRCKLLEELDKSVG